MTVKFTRYHLPNGRRSDFLLEIQEPYDKMGNDLIDAGYKFDIEVLSTGMISATCEPVYVLGYDDEVVIAHVLTPSRDNRLLMINLGILITSAHNKVLAV